MLRILRQHLARRRRRGQALVEMALMLPLLLFLMMGILQFAALTMVWINLQGVAQDTVRWMAISSQAPGYTAYPTCGTGTTPYPRPRWADADSGVNYRDCTLAANGLLRRGSSFYPTWTWTPACVGDCVASGARQSDQMLRLTASYDWSNVVFMPGGLRGWFGWVIPATVTVQAAEVMQY
jgi:hypothetical protein